MYFLNITGKERKLLHALRKIFIIILAATVIHTFPVPQAAAVGTSVKGYGKDVVTIGITAQDEKMDFVTEYPEIDIELIQNGKPSADLANQKRQDYVSIPLYFQNDYPDILYGSGTVETSGCSITSLAMVATYLTGYEYLPDELAYYFGGRAENNIARLEYAANALGLPYEKPENWNYTYAELEAGKCAIILVDADSPFTESQHFLVLTGLTEDGKVMVNDSYAPNYDKWELQQGFENGFTEPEIWKGYNGAWVFDKKAMPETIKRYIEETPDPENSRYPDLELTFAERQLLARVVWVEARGESPEGQQAVAEVVFNRMMSDGFPNNLQSVIFGEGQFRSVKFLDDAEPNQTQYQAIERAMYGPYVLPTDVTYFARFAVNNNVWGTIGGHIFCYEHEKVEEATEIVSES